MTRSGLASIPPLYARDCFERERPTGPSPDAHHLLNRPQDGIATDLVQLLGSLIHTFRLGGDARGIHIYGRRSRHIVRRIYGTGLATVHAAAVAGEGD
jgi:hypothetical protein